MHEAFTSGNGVRFRAARDYRGRRLPTTTRNPWLRQIFEEQDRLNISATALAKAAKMHVRTLHRLRHPSGYGKHPSWEHIVSLAEALDFKVPMKLTKNGD